eukprot:4078627-Amphidinium_carterae.1
MCITISATSDGLSGAVYTHGLDIGPRKCQDSCVQTVWEGLERSQSAANRAHVIGAHGQASTQSGSELELIGEGVVEVEVDVGFGIEDVDEIDVDLEVDVGVDVDDIDELRLVLTLL